jgi:N-dimethylarginine dimethylaminohydrolase
MLRTRQSPLTNSPLERRAHFLMCAPHHFEVKYRINPWMDPDAWATKATYLAAAADMQWQTLYEALVARGATVEVIRAIPDRPDLVFTANAAVILDRKALLARFRHPERRLEEPVYASALHKTALDLVAELPKNLGLEGAGWDRKRKHFWLGFGPRSDLASHRVVADFFDVDCVPLELSDLRFYHLDTAFCALPFGEIIFYPTAVTEAARRAINERVALNEQIILSETDAAAFAANSVSFGRHILLSSCSQELRRQLEERNYEVITTPLHTFQLSGGSACCLTLRVDYQTERAGSPRKLAPCPSPLRY